MATAGQDHLYKKVQLAGDGVDPYTDCVGAISEEHLMAHLGNMFHVSGKVTLAAGASHSLLFRVPAFTYPHLSRVRLTTSQGDVDILSFEDSTITAPGALAPMFNTNRNSANTPGMQVYFQPTVSADGTQLHTLWAHPTQLETGISEVSKGEEWILKPDTDYLLRITNNNASAITHVPEILWYEIGATP